MLWALGQPVALAGLLVAFLLSLYLRHTTAKLCERFVRRWGKNSDRRSLSPLPSFRLKSDVDPFGAVAAAVSGVGWGRGNETASRGLSVLAGPLVVIGASQFVFAGYHALNLPTIPLAYLSGIDVLRGVSGDPLEQFTLALAVGLLGCGLLALVPLPPLDGWALMRFAKSPREGPGFAKARYWLEDQNIGVAILLGCLLLPLIQGAPLLLYVMDYVLTPVLRAWS